MVVDGNEAALDKYLNGQEEAEKRYTEFEADVCALVDPLVIQAKEVFRELQDKYGIDNEDFLDWAGNV